MSDAALADVLNRLVERLDRLEAKVDRLGSTVERAEAILDRLPAVADAAGTSAQWGWDQLAARGIDPFALGEKTADLALKAAKPEMLAIADRLVDHASDVNFALDKVEHLDSKLVAAGTTRAEVADRAIAIAVKASSPRALVAVEKLLDRTADLEFALSSLEKLDAKLAAAGTTREALVDRTLDVAARVAAVGSAEQTALTAPFERSSLDMVGKTMAALIATRQETAPQVGLFGAMRMMGDPDVQRAVGFSLLFAKKLGASLS